MGVLYSVYLRSLRLKHAVLLMDHGIDSVKNVALLSGFNDPLYFSTVFRNSTGISPKEYMAKVQEAQGDIPNR
jgi:AraC-like DNA-binding protein